MSLKPWTAPFLFSNAELTSAVTDPSSGSLSDDKTTVEGGKWRVAWSQTFIITIFMIEFMFVQVVFRDLSNSTDLMQYAVPLSDREDWATF